MSLKVFEAQFEGFKWVETQAKTGVEAIEAVTQKIESWGDGARGAVFGVWDIGEPYGHYFSFEVFGEHVYLVDSQIGSGNVYGNFDRMIPGSIKVARLDNLKTKRSINSFINKSKAK